MNGQSLRARPAPYFALLLAFSLPFWWLRAATGAELFPGLPVSALMALCPALAAVVLVWRDHGLPGVSRLLRRSLDFDRIRPRIWYLPIVLLMPAIMLVAYAIGVTSTDRPARVHVAAATVIAMAAGFMLAGITEELGWSGYVIDPMRRRLGALRAAIVVGIAWAVWHTVPLLQAHRDADWIAWWSLNTVATRILIVWIYSNTDSVFAASLYHAVGNVCMLLYAEYYDPRITGLVAASVAAIVAAAWGPATLARWRGS